MTKKSDTGKNKEAIANKIGRDSSTGKFIAVKIEKHGYQATVVHSGPIKPPKGGTGQSGTKK